MHVALAGASGYLGRHLAPRLRARGHEVTTLGRRDADVTVDLLQAPPPWGETAPEVLVLAAGIMTSDPRTLGDALRLTDHALAGLPSTVRRVVLVSSAYVYAPATSPATEEAPLAATDPYGASKIAVEARVTAFTSARGAELAVLRPCAIYGPGDPHRKAVSVFVEAARAGKPPLLHGPVRAARDYIHVDDAATAVTLATEGHATGAFNVCTGVSASALEVAAILGDLRPDLALSLEGGPRQDELGYRFSPEKAARELGFRAQISLREGIRAMLEATP